MADKRCESVGSLIEKLARFPFRTEILTNCAACQRGTAGGFISIRDNTQQTFGYIELETNRGWVPSPQNINGVILLAAQIMEEMTSIRNSKFSTGLFAPHNRDELLFMYNDKLQTYEKKTQDIRKAEKCILIDQEKASHINDRYRDQAREYDEYGPHDSGGYYASGYLAAFTDLSTILGVDLSDLLNEEKGGRQ